MSLNKFLCLLFGCSLPDHKVFENVRCLRCNKLYEVYIIDTGTTITTYKNLKRSCYGMAYKTKKSPKKGKKGY